MAENRTDALALAQEYMANAVRTYREAGYDPAAKSYSFKVWSFGADDAARLRQSAAGAALSDDGALLIRRSDLDDRGITYETHRFEVGDVDGLAAWIREQEDLGRAWTVPVWCGRKEEGKPIAQHHRANVVDGIRDSHDTESALLVEDGGDVRLKTPVGAERND